MKSEKLKVESEKWKAKSEKLKINVIFFWLFTVCALLRH